MRMGCGLAVASLFLSCCQVTAKDGGRAFAGIGSAVRLHRDPMLVTMRSGTHPMHRPGEPSFRQSTLRQLRQTPATLPSRAARHRVPSSRVLSAAVGSASPNSDSGAPAVGEARWRVATFRACVAFSSAVLESLDLFLRLGLALLRVVYSALHAMRLSAVTAGARRVLASAEWGPLPGARKRVAIVGASFGGLACARMLRRDFDVTVIDQHDYFEYTPGILRLFIKPQHMAGLSAQLHGVAGITFVHGRVDHLGKKSVRVRPAAGAKVSAAEREFGTKIPFDFGIIACGSAYSAGIKAGSSSALLQDRTEFWKTQARRVAGVPVP